MPFVDNDDVMETLSADRAYEPLTIRILPGRLRRTNDFLDTHVIDALAKELTVDAIAISDQKSGRCIVRERFYDLLRRPLSRRMRGYVEVDYMSSMMTENDEGEQYTECRCRNGEEVDRHDVSQVIIQECSPSL